MNKKLNPNLLLLLLIASGIIFFSIYYNKSSQLERALDKIEISKQKLDSSLAIVNKKQLFIDSLLAKDSTLLIQLEKYNTESQKSSISIKNKLLTTQQYLDTINNIVKNLPTSYQLPK